MPQYLVNQGKGLLVEIRHNDTAATVNGLIKLFVPPDINLANAEERSEYGQQLMDILKGDGLNIGGIEFILHNDRPDRWEAAILYIDSLENAKSAVLARRNFVIDPSRLTQLTERERENWPHDPWDAKNHEWEAAVQARRTRPVSGRESP